MGLLVIICVGMLGVGFLTFAFTTTVCGQAPLAFPNGNIGGGSMIYNGYAYGMDKFEHPAAAGIAGGSNPLYTQFDASAKDGSFLFQKVNQNCLGIITPAAGTGIPSNGQELGWYFPCNLYNQWGSSSVNKTGYAEGVLCHTQSSARSQFTSLEQLGRVSFEWSDLQNTSRNIGVYDG
jgi:chitin synthase